MAYSGQPQQLELSAEAATRWSLFARPFEASASRCRLLCCITPAAIKSKHRLLTLCFTAVPQDTLSQPSFIARQVRGASTKCYPGLGTTVHDTRILARIPWVAPWSLQRIIRSLLTVALLPARLLRHPVVAFCRCKRPQSCSCLPRSLTGLLVLSQLGSAATVGIPACLAVVGFMSAPSCANWSSHGMLQTRCFPCGFAGASHRPPHLFGAGIRGLITWSQQGTQGAICAQRSITLQRPSGLAPFLTLPVISIPPFWDTTSF